MITEELKTQIESMTQSERHELSAYLTKLELENDPDYWKVIRQRNEGRDRQLVNVDSL
jgi:hypothetical protein